MKLHWNRLALIIKTEHRAVKHEFPFFAKFNQPSIRYYAWLQLGAARYYRKLCQRAFFAFCEWFLILGYCDAYLIVFMNKFFFLNAQNIPQCSLIGENFSLVRKIIKIKKKNMRYDELKSIFSSIALKFHISDMNI